ncbi:hypothetical protein OHA42_38270 [Nocardia sp. NBC_01009]|nr:hypothetical protein OHA42_38270 [Nocardia sp. NBC_01009]
MPVPDCRFAGFGVYHGDSQISVGPFGYTDQATHPFDLFGRVTHADCEGEFADTAPCGRGLLTWLAEYGENLA